MVYPCFWVEETGESLVRFRRWTWEPVPSCRNPYGHCYETVDTGIVIPTRRTADYFLEFIRPGEFLGHPAWPSKCSYCGRMFGPLDVDGVCSFAGNDQNDQVSQEPFYTDGVGNKWPMDRLPVGAMFDATWRQDGPDGISLTVVLPYPNQDARNGFWHVDCPASNSDTGWQRTGDPKSKPPTVSATPSIATSWYHSHLTNGVLGDDLENRTMP